MTLTVKLLMHDPGVMIRFLRFLFLSVGFILFDSLTAFQERNWDII